jgi:hypothetical protein
MVADYGKVKQRMLNYGIEIMDVLILKVVL